MQRGTSALLLPDERAAPERQRKPLRGQLSSSIQELSVMEKRLSTKNKATKDKELVAKEEELRTSRKGKKEPPAARKALKPLEKK